MKNFFYIAAFFLTLHFPAQAENFNIDPGIRNYLQSKALFSVCPATRPLMAVVDRFEKEAFPAGLDAKQVAVKNAVGKALYAQRDRAVAEGKIAFRRDCEIVATTTTKIMGPAEDYTRKTLARPERITGEPLILRLTGEVQDILDPRDDIFVFKTRP